MIRLSVTREYEVGMPSGSVVMDPECATHRASHPPPPYRLGPVDTEQCAAGASIVGVCAIQEPKGTPISRNFENINMQNASFTNVAHDGMLDKKLEK
jgi:hypothetical protein